MTECIEQRLLFQEHGRREVVADFDGGRITSDAGGLLPREVENPYQELFRTILANLHRPRPHPALS